MSSVCFVGSSEEGEVHVMLIVSRYSYIMLNQKK